LTALFTCWGVGRVDGAYEEIDIARRNTPSMAVRRRMSTVQPSSECFFSGAGDVFVAVSVTCRSRTAMLIIGFDYKHGVSY